MRVGWEDHCSTAPKARRWAHHQTGLHAHQAGGRLPVAEADLVPPAEHLHRGPAHDLGVHQRPERLPPLVERVTDALEEQPAGKGVGGRLQDVPEGRQITLKKLTDGGINRGTWTGHTS